MRTVHQLTYEEQCLHQLDEYTTSGGVTVKWTGNPLGAKGTNTWNLTHPLVPRVYVVQDRDTENPKGMGPNKYAWGHTWSSAKLALERNPRTAEVVMAEALEHIAALVAKKRLGILAGA